MRTQRRRVYVIGAGFSEGLGYPLMKDILAGLWNHVGDTEFKQRMVRAMKFYYPNCRGANFPNIEELLSLMVVNQQLLDSSRQYEREFAKEDLGNLQHSLLLKVSKWFHCILQGVNPSMADFRWLYDFRDRVMRENAVIISFNWDLVLDQLILGENLNASSYGLSRTLSEGPVLLKPHGSLNWFERNPGRFITDKKRTLIFHRKRSTRVYAFREFRAPVSTTDREYAPLIVPPVYSKDFAKPAFTTLWQNCTNFLSTASRVTFIGYSMPATDLHAHLIMRCGFHNQLKARLTRARRGSPARPAEVIVIDPSPDTAYRIRTMVGSQHRSQCFSAKISDFSWDQVDGEAHRG